MADRNSNLHLRWDGWSGGGQGDWTGWGMMRWERVPELQAQSSYRGSHHCIRIQAIGPEQLRAISGGPPVVLSGPPLDLGEGFKHESYYKKLSKKPIGNPLRSF